MAIAGGRNWVVGGWIDQLSGDLGECDGVSRGEEGREN
jgi:hypothetical protein